MVIITCTVAASEVSDDIRQGIDRDVGYHLEDAVVLLMTAA